MTAPLDLLAPHCQDLVADILRTIGQARLDAEVQGREVWQRELEWARQAVVSPPLGHEPKRIKARTVEQRLGDLEKRVANRFGEAGAEIVEENRR